MQTISWVDETSWMKFMAVVYWILLVPAFAIWSPIVVPVALVYCAFTNVVPMTTWLGEYGFIALRILSSLVGKIFDQVIIMIIKDLGHLALWICWNCFVPTIKFLWLLAQLGWGAVSAAVVILVGLPSLSVTTLWAGAAAVLKFVSGSSDQTLVD